ncbi:MAG TPA: hypothetical protein VEB59_11355, partial [Gemmatimonadales bacterium]|nr:hypothetical protein [Gemmatimonadales bacterium]
MPIGFTRPGKITEAKRQVASKEVAGGGKKVNPVLLSMLAEAASTTMDAMTGGESPVAEADGSYDGKDSKEEDVGALHLALSGLQSYLKALGPAGKKYAFDATEALSSDDAALELYRKLTAAASDAGFLVAAANGPKPPADAKDETTT